MKKTLCFLTVFLAVGMSCSCDGMSRSDKKHLTQRVGGGVENAASEFAKTKSRTTTTATAETANWNVVGLPKASITVDEHVLERYAYVASYNSEYRIPNWVMWRLTASHTEGSYKREGIKFTEDTDVSNSPTTYDYQRTGYDRGHMCPSADNRWSKTAQEQCFLMTNICPQNHNLNAGDWSEMEKQCREWAKQYGEIYIVCGPVLFKGKHKKIAKTIVVPEAFFKVVYCPSRQKAIGFIYRNTEGNRPKGDYVNTVDEVERITGYDFFPNLPKDIQDPMEATASLEDW